MLDLLLKLWAEVQNLPLHIKRPTIFALLFGFIGFLVIEYFGIHDIYYEKFSQSEYKSMAIGGYRIVNNSQVNTKKIEFEFRIDIPDKKIQIRYYEMTDEEKKRLEDPNCVFLVDVQRGGCSVNVIPSSNNSSKISLVRTEGLERGDSFSIGLWWLRQTDKQCGKTRLKIGRKEYPSIENRSWFYKHDTILIFITLSIPVFVWFVVSQRKIYSLQKEVKKRRREVKDEKDAIKRLREEESKINRDINQHVPPSLVVKFKSHPKTPPE